MKVLFIGNYRDGTGWAHSALSYMMAMDSVGIDVIPRFIKLNNIDGEIPERIKELESKSDKGCDIIIQNVLPHMLDYSGRFKKNIAICAFETSNFKRTPWAAKINTMDELWVHCNQSKDIAINSNVQIPINVVPISFNIELYEQRYEKINIPELNGKFVFYFIGEMIRRKNIESLLIAFHSEFRQSENVGLLLKTGVPGASAEQNAKLIKDFTDNIKKNIKLYPSLENYIGEIGFSARLNENDIMKLHNSCDCFVMPSYAEAFCIPAFEAMAMGRPIIANNVGGLADFLPSDSLVDNRPEPCFNMLDTFNELGSSDETWYSIDIYALRNKMRTIYEDKDYRKHLIKEGINNSYEYSYQKIGNQIKELLEC